MNNYTLNIYVAGQSLADMLSELSHPEGLTCLVHPLNNHTHINSHSHNILILKNIPSRTIPGAKYILCTKSPAQITPSQLNTLYDLWPEPLTPSLLKFHYTKLTERIMLEVENTSEAQEHRKRILEMARQDYLTGLATRWYLEEYIKLNASNKLITCIYLDLDNFKSVNDTYGHQAGDRVLAVTAEMMQQEFDDGFCARMGGDEFMIVLIGDEYDVNDVVRRFERFSRRLTMYYGSYVLSAKLSVSAGVTQVRSSGDDTDGVIERVINESDGAMYDGKRSGKEREDRGK